MHIFYKLHPEDEAKLDALLAVMRRIEDRQIAMAIREHPLMRDISDILRAVTAETSLASAAALALQAASQHFVDAQGQIDTLKAQLAANTLDPAQVQTLLDTVATASAQLSAAIPANTGTPGTVEQPVGAGAVAGATGLASAGLVTAASPNAPGTAVLPTETQVATGIGNVPAVPAAAIDPAAAAAVVVDPAP